MDRFCSSVAEMRFSRRKFLTHTAVAACSSFFPQLLQANTKFSSERTLEFINLHTDEKVNSRYWLHGEYDLEGLSEINQILRDHRANQIFAIDTSLLDFLHRLHHATNSNSPFHVISAYRSPETNKKLRQASNGVAKRSLHMQGKAIDIRLPDIDLAQLRDTAITLNAGGVGYYPKSNFIHIDTGRPRSWG